MPYMVENNGKVVGPYSLAELSEAVAASTIALTDRGCDQSSGQWVPVAQLLSGRPASISSITSNQKSHSGFNTGMFAGMGGFLVTVAYLLWRAFRLMNFFAHLHHPH